MQIYLMDQRSAEKVMEQWEIPHAQANLVLNKLHNFYNRKVTNLQFSRENKEFLKACADANVEPTRRQASKFRAKFGTAYETFRRTKNQS